MSIYEGFDPSQVPEPFGNRHDPKHTDTSSSGDLVERLRLCATHGLPASYNDHAEAADRIEALEAENERLRGMLEVVWKEATTMRNASKLVGPYPKEPANNRVWARSMYHAGRKLHALIKPVRAALGEKQ